MILAGKVTGKGPTMAVAARREFVAELLRGPVALAAAGAVANFFNLVMNLVLARVLSTRGYGAVVEQTNIYMVLSVVGLAVLTAVVHRDLGQLDNTRSLRWGWIRKLRNVIGFSTVGAAVVAIALCKPVAVLLSYPHPFAIAEAAIAASVWVSVCVERGLLQARRNYLGLARNVVLEAAFRFVGIVVLAAVGLGVNGAGLGLVLGLALAGEFARWTAARTPSPGWATGGDQARPAAPRPALAATAVARRTRDGLIADTSVALATLAPLAVLQNIDVVIVGWRNPAGVGGYAAISTASKIPVFIGLAVANYLLAEAARRRQAGESASRALAMALTIVVAPGLLLAAAGAVAGHGILAVLFGPKLTAAAPALPVLALAMTALSVTLMFASYLLGAGYRKVVWVLAVCTPLTVVALTLANGAIMRTAVAGLLCQTLAAVLTGALVVRLLRAGRVASRPRPAVGAELAVPAQPGVPVVQEVMSR
ncbi:lipopolysaccharide biosynthesis protein [Frankia sp. AgB1.9]|nr:lipopolysaccharide biosynthesis protein [Frankia sp. AgW1.1]MBL7547899.1 lipopolysaccharide biosynthesis protein [Frankia sp. AgB1.9]MBL7621377.1 lipopolysaccharide biosynthesis protein [Frankia sp. AgB1.8]